jgi:hypothetical protein
LSRARSPGAPPISRAGQPSTFESGRTTFDAFIETPKKSRRTPRPSASSLGAVARPLASDPMQTSTIASTSTTSAVTGPKRDHRDGGSTEPSRTAAIGGTRVARRAGRRLAISVISVPTSSETTIVRPAKTVVPVGRLIPIAWKSAFRPFASSRPRKSPTTEPTSPITSASMITDQSTWRRDAPIVRSVANSRMRWAIVIPSVFAITKAPTKTAIPAKASSAYLITSMKPRSFLSSFTCSVAFRTVAVDGSRGRISDASFAAETPDFDCTWIASSCPALRKSRCAVGWSKIANVTPPSETLPEYLATPLMRNWCTGP